MTGKKTGTKKKTKAGASDAKRAALLDEAPDMADDEGFWARAKPFVPTEPKAQLTLRLDSDVVAWFKGHGRGYQTRINDALRAFMRHNSRPRVRQ